MLRTYTAALSVALLTVSFVGCGSEQSASLSGTTEEADASYAESYADRYGAPQEAAAGDDGYARPEPSGSASPVVSKSVVPVPDVKIQPSGTPMFEQQPVPESPVLQPERLDGDRYRQIVENGFVPVRDAPLSTFSIDVDTASYAKTRMYLQQRNVLPPPDAVRIEELVNYFDYEYSPPADNDPFAVHLEVARAPWQPQHLLARVGIKGREMDDRPTSNLVFLIDVSGSMNRPNKLGLVKEGLKLLTSQLQDEDRVSIVVYAGAAGLVLPPTQGDNRHVIMAAVERLSAGGSTNGGEGIRLAYQVARQNFVKGGVNRVLLCTDGDFNVGTTGTGDLVRLAADQARSGVFLSVLGFGMGNHNDAMLEELSNKANGNYAFIDSDREARKVLLDQLDSTLVTIAKDVKIQIEFNPVHVASYRLIGYENRRLEDRDFNDDKKDAGEIGAGHTVTALYELVMAAGENDDATDPQVDPLKYQTPRKLADAADSDDLFNLKLRFKRPHNDRSELAVFPVENKPLKFGQATKDFQFAAAVAEFGMLLRNSQFRGDANYAEVLEIAGASRGRDGYGYRTEFLQLVATARRIAEPHAAAIVIPPHVAYQDPQQSVTLPPSVGPAEYLPLRWLVAVAFAVWLLIVAMGLVVVVWAIWGRPPTQSVLSDEKASPKLARSPFA